MDAFESPELLALYHAYTAAADSVAAHFNRSAAADSASRPLIVGTATDIVLFTGGGAVPIVERIRTSTRGFKELAGVSHLGAAVAAARTIVPAPEAR